MRVITANVNGVRAAARKGFFDWLAGQDADVVCLQELKAQEDQLSDQIFHPQGYHRFMHCAQKKGYSGVAIYARKQPDNVSYGLGWEVADSEGRYVQADFGDLSVASLYLPSGTSGDERQALKYQFLDKMEPLLKGWRDSGRHYILCGDWNIAHKEIDLKNWKPNQKNSGFLPDERAWLDKLFGEMAYVDAFREVNTDADEYTWWSQRGRARENNVGWRIDYHIVSESLRPKISNALIYRDENFSDHAPLIIDYDIDLGP